LPHDPPSRSHLLMRHRSGFRISHAMRAGALLLSSFRFAQFGEGEIRTLDTLRYAGFRNRCFRPLSHLSFGQPSRPPAHHNRDAQKNDLTHDKIPHFRLVRKYAIFCGTRLYRLMVRTAPFQGVNPGSIPGRVILQDIFLRRQRPRQERRLARAHRGMAAGQGILARFESTGGIFGMQRAA
jgi:hypothetical protein